MGPNQTYKLFAQQRKQLKKPEKTTYRMGENTCKRCNPQGLNIQNIQTTHTTQQQQNKQPNQKMDRRPTPGLLSEENHDLKRYMCPSVHCSIIYNSQDMETT